MKSTELDITGEKVRVKWGSVVTGLPMVRQKLVVTMNTDKGSDRTFPDRGTNLRRNVFNGSVYNPQKGQHELNFAALDARRFVRDHETEDFPSSERVGSFRSILEEISGGSIVSRLETITADGTSDVTARNL